MPMEMHCILVRMPTRHITGRAAVQRSVVQALIATQHTLIAAVQVWGEQTRTLATCVLRW